MKSGSSASCEGRNIASCTRRSRGGSSCRCAPRQLSAPRPAAARPPPWPASWRGRTGPLGLQREAARQVDRRDQPRQRVNLSARGAARPTGSCRAAPTGRRCRSARGADGRVRRRARACMAVGGAPVRRTVLNEHERHDGVEARLAEIVEVGGRARRGECWVGFRRGWRRCKCHLRTLSTPMLEQRPWRRINLP